MAEDMIIVCPGQGAQTVGMGKAWADLSPEARGVFDEADEILGDSLGSKLSTICFEGPTETLNRTDVSQPALYTCAVACWRGMSAQMGLAEGEAPIVAAAGLSLGEYSALHIAGSFSFADGLRLVALRGRAMQEAAEATASGMVALVGADEEQANKVCDEAREGGVLVCANFNAPGQVVLSGDAEACKRAEQVAGDQGIRAVALQVAGAFHSPIMQPAADALAKALSEVSIVPPRVPVWSNVTAGPHADNEGSIRAKLAEQLTSPVRWADSYGAMVEKYAGAQVHEMAPGKTLAGMAKRINRSVKVQSHDGPEV
ncbi:MAG: [acyl-carrier-protein] S-malonyltransferase [Phycisphaera sp.]|nr:MAG: [acyl-carrier-protein] S-malonyltransferase [Phycisphaera sp.]